MIKRVVLNYDKRNVSCFRLLYNRLTPTRGAAKFSKNLELLSSSSDLKLKVHEADISIKGPGEKNMLPYSSAYAACLFRAGIEEIEIGRGSTSKEIKRLFDSLSDKKVKSLKPFLIKNNTYFHTFNFIELEEKYTNFISSNDLIEAYKIARMMRESGSLNGSKLMDEALDHLKREFFWRKEKGHYYDAIMLAEKMIEIEIPNAENLLVEALESRLIYNLKTCQYSTIPSTLKRIRMLEIENKEKTMKHFASLIKTGLEIKYDAAIKSGYGNEALKIAELFFSAAEEEKSADALDKARQMLQKPLVEIFRSLLESGEFTEALKIVEKMRHFEIPEAEKFSEELIAKATGKS